MLPSSNHPSLTFHRAENKAFYLRTPIDGGLWLSFFISSQFTLENCPGKDKRRFYSKSILASEIIKVMSIQDNKPARIQERNKFHQILPTFRFVEKGWMGYTYKFPHIFTVHLSVANPPSQALPQNTPFNPSSQRSQPCVQFPLRVPPLRDSNLSGPRWQIHRLVVCAGRYV